MTFFSKFWIAYFTALLLIGWYVFAHAQITPDIQFKINNDQTRIAYDTSQINQYTQDEQAANADLNAQEQVLPQAETFDIQQANAVSAQPSLNAQVNQGT